MASELARNGGKRHALLSAIRQKMAEDRDAQLRPSEAVMVLEWAIECEDNFCKAELLNIFSAMGGLTLMKDVFADLH
ncbi:hypothetical protein [Roseovarius aestuarii]|uniref:Uncharacterized protein n=2 Tax=Roseovarius aestuarii TaxID=475083 RepID=A0A1X7BU81_9RHOB|nr:hypothetical protein [Roseovarius aestuarii]SMC13182.1 hypothetical protein ROA7745_03021 [Roseovarius aestuarii]